MAMMMRGPGRNAARTRLLRTLRGDGQLIIAGEPTPVSYSIDVFDAGPRRNARGSIDAEISLEGVEEATLRLAAGLELTITLDDQDEGGASFEVLTPELLDEVEPPPQA